MVKKEINQFIQPTYQTRNYTKRYNNNNNSNLTKYPKQDIKLLTKQN